MSKYIDADKLKRHYAWWETGTDEMSFDEAKKTFDEIIDLQPAADVAEVRHGRWVGGEDAGKYCSVCHQRTLSAACMNATFDGIEYRQVITPFCMWCGAKMDEVSE